MKKRPGQKVIDFLNKTDFIPLVVIGTFVKGEDQTVTEGGNLIHPAVYENHFVLTQVLQALEKLYEELRRTHDENYPVSSDSTLDKNTSRSLD